MNSFDRAILTWLNHFARASYTLDAIVAALATSNAVKGGLATVVLLWFWFGGTKTQQRNRQIIIATMVAASVAIVTGRLLAFALPFRIRPVHNVDLAFVAPYGYPEGLLRGWSAFPSDHAMLFAAMATGLGFISRRLGLAAYAYVLLVILAPRVYLGMHHPTDVLFGALLGTAFALVVNTERIRTAMAQLPLRWSEVHPRSFYAAGFVVAMQVATMFEGPRELARDVMSFLRSNRCTIDQPCADRADARAADRPLGAAIPAAEERVLPVPSPAAEPTPARTSETALR